MSQQNIAQVRRAIAEIWNGGNYDALPGLVSDDIVIHGSSPEADIRGPEGIRHFYSSLRDAFPDLHFQIEDQTAWSPAGRPRAPTPARSRASRPPASRSR